jgi:hypothetical protein
MKRKNKAKLRGQVRYAVQLRNEEGLLIRFEEETCRSLRWLGQKTGHSQEAFMVRRQ